MTWDLNVLYTPRSVRELATTAAQLQFHGVAINFEITTTSELSEIQAVLEEAARLQNIPTQQLLLQDGRNLSMLGRGRSSPKASITSKFRQFLDEVIPVPGIFLHVVKRLTVAFDEPKQIAQINAVLKLARLLRSDGAAKVEGSGRSVLGTTSTSGVVDQTLQKHCRDFVLAVKPTQQSTVPLCVFPAIAPYDIFCPSDLRLLRPQATGLLKKGVLLELPFAPMLKSLSQQHLQSHVASVTNLVRLTGGQNFCVVSGARDPLDLRSAADLANYGKVLGVKTGSSGQTNRGKRGGSSGSNIQQSGGGQDFLKGLGGGGLGARNWRALTRRLEEREVVKI